MRRRSLAVPPLVLFFLLAVTTCVEASWPGWPNGIPAFRAPATLIDATPGDLADYQQILQVATGDIDGNGLPDLCVLYRDSTAAGSVTNKVAFVMNHKEPGGPGIMSWPKAMPGYQPLGGTGPDGIQLGDMDTDGRADLVTFSAALGVIRVQFSTGAMLKAPNDYSVPATWTLQQIQIENRNQDYWNDLYVRYIDPFFAPNTERIGVFGNVYATLSKTAEVPYFATSSGSMKIARTGGSEPYPDILVNRGSSVELSSAFNEFDSNGAGTVFDLGVTVYDFAVGRLDADPYPDLAVLTESGGPPTIYVCRGNANGFDPPSATPYFMSISSRHLAISDMNGDGIGEIYASGDQVTSQGGIQVLDWANPSFSYNIFLSPGRMPGVCVFDDVDGDSNPDLIAGLSGVGDHNIAIIQDLSAANRGVQVDVVAASSPSIGSPAVADFNRDGRPDLAVSVGANTYIKQGVGSETFAPGAVLPAWASERDYAVDLNRDGKPDLFSSGNDFGDDAFRVQLGNGDGTFQGQQVITLGATVPRHPFGDMNRDGIQDLVFLDKVGMAAGVYLEDGAGNLSGIYGSVSGLLSRPEDVAVVDLDRDGDLDLAIATQAGVQVAINTGTGLVLGPIWDSGHDYKTIAAGDVDRDGKPDVVAQERIGVPYDRRTRGIQIFYGNGAAQVARRDSLGANERWGDMLEISDVNRDGRPDIVEAAYNDGLEGVGYPPATTGVHLQNASGGFGQRVDYAQGYVGLGGFALLADATGDGQQDILSMNVGPSVNGSVICQISPGNSPAGGWGASAQLDFGGTTFPHGLAWGDMNRDGKPDLVATDVAGGIFVYFGDGNGGLATPPYTIPTVACDDVALADLDRDGRLDVIAAGENGHVVVLLGQGNGALTAPVEYSAASGPLRRVKVGDFNRDGKPDVVALGDGGQLSIFLGGNNGGIFMSQALPLPAGGVAVEVADLNRDGIQDLALLVNDNAPAVYTALGNGTGAFSPVGVIWSLQDTGWPYSLAMTDVNGDGKVDIAATFTGDTGGTIYLLYGNGSNGVSSYLTYGGLDETHWMAFGDLDGDPWPDLVVASYNGLGACFGNRSGSLSAVQFLPSGSTPEGIAIADLNRDGKNDIAFCDGPNGTVSLLINNKSNVTAVAESGPRALRPALAQNAPNPFNPRTSIAFTMAQAGPAKLAVYDVQGRQVAKLVDAKLSAGPHRVDWDGRAGSGEPAASGVYFYRLEAAGRAISRRMVLLK